MNKDKIFYILGLVLVSAGVVLALAAVVLSIAGYTLVSDVIFWIASTIGIVAFIFLILRLRMQVNNSSFNAPKGPQIKVKIVDVKDLPKSKEEQLYEQYENLYKQNLITKEDLEKKKEELLGKK